MLRAVVERWGPEFRAFGCVLGKGWACPSGVIGVFLASISAISAKQQSITDLTLLLACLRLSLAVNGSAGHKWR